MIEEWRNKALDMISILNKLDEEDRKEVIEFMRNECIEHKTYMEIALSLMEDNKDCHA